MNRSLTITGLVVLVGGFLAEKFGIPLADGALEITIITLIEIFGAIIAYIGRYRQGDINILGRKKTKTEPIV